MARGSIHAHGCAKLSNDPGLCNLVKTAVQGWKLEQILRLHKQHPSYHQMANDSQLQIQASHQAQATVIAYADWLVTTINDVLPQNNWTVPLSHPSAISIENVENLDTDYTALVNSVQRHTKCSTDPSSNQHVDLIFQRIVRMNLLSTSNSSDQPRVKTVN